MPAPKGHAPYPGCEKGGRPREHTDEFIEAEADAFEEWMQRPDSIWYKDFCLERNYHSDYLPKWAGMNEKFNRTYKKSQEWQQSKLVNGAITSKFNPGFTKFVMNNTCGWSERQHIEHSGGVTIEKQSYKPSSAPSDSKVDG